MSASSTEHVTFCRICEAACGLIATVEDGRLVQLRPDKEHPLSQGFACPKGILMTDIQNDPDRVLRPLKRNHTGQWEKVSWDEALDDIASRLRASLKAEGANSVGWYFGNPTAFSYSHVLWLQGFLFALGITHAYSAGSQDINNRFAASALLYGQVTSLPIPDLDRTDFLLVIGANPVVSHGSAISAPRMKEQMKAIVARGGRVVVVDPRRSETAALFEHVDIHPNGDAHLLLSLLQVIFAEDLADEAAIGRQSTGVDFLRSATSAFTPEATETFTGLAAGDVRALAHAVAAAPSAAIYGRTGSCLGRNGTVVAYLLDALALVTGNLDRAGGLVFGDAVVPVENIGRKLGLLGYDTRRSRVGGFPDVMGTFPASVMAQEITTGGVGQLRTLFVSAGNPVLSVPNGGELVEALRQLDLFVSLDIYVNETNKHADYILPATTWLERDDVSLASLPLFTKPFAQYTPAVLEAYGEAREEWQIIEDLACRAGISTFMPTRWLSWGPIPASVGRGASRGLASLRNRLPSLTPARLIDAGLRAGSKGKLTLARLRAHPHGLVLAEELAVGRLKHVVKHREGKVRLNDPRIVEALANLDQRGTSSELPLRLIGLRELRSHNSWMHNAPNLMRGKRTHRMRVHPKDAADLGIEEGQLCQVRSAHGQISLPATISDEMRVGTVAVPHGWGHQGGWRVANAAGGANVNSLASSKVEDLEKLAGMAFLNGIPVSVTPAR